MLIFRCLRCLLLLPAVLSAGSSAAPAAIHVGTTKQLLHDDFIVASLHGATKFSHER